MAKREKPRGNKLEETRRSPDEEKAVLTLTVVARIIGRVDENVHGVAEKVAINAKVLLVLAVDLAE